MVIPKELLSTQGSINSIDRVYGAAMAFCLTAKRKKINATKN